MCRPPSTNGSIPGQRSGPAQVAVIHRRRLVVIVAGGLADVSGRLVPPDTLFWAASTAKGVAATGAHVLADRRLLDYEMPLSTVWPEFAAHGKDDVTVRHVLCHTPGVPGLPADLTPAELCEWEHMCTPRGRGDVATRIDTVVAQSIGGLHHD